MQWKLTIKSELRIPTPLTSSDLNAPVKGTSLAGLGEVWKYAEYRYNINALFLASLAILESGWGRSKLAQKKNNIYGFMAYDRSPYASAKAFPSKAHCIIHVAQYLDREYLTPGGKFYNGITPKAIGKFYASDPDWAYKVCRVANLSFSPSF
ncbi:N-acetylmuramoyl-L-alanine amidase [bacterium 3DAC]|nr:N-acetylmuramoyl-L-alanine amidase [Dictyoglomota bacterium]UZN22352.1 N-acetylmuramoyl-L-alanine amidase [bacterium 3DAC]